ncbi:MAG: ABC transporter substrate-binding protein [Motiliproteus sp.]|nr:ABC transporter substrate-binding protein [Motiliproteus sp.]MCW9051179.1 ABC transporter substrate-binding protein [Motiliproteus sp.]
MAAICRIFVCLALGLLSVTAQVQAKETFSVGYLELIQERPPLLSNVLPIPEDDGLQGARLGLADNNSAGRFLGQHFELLEAKDSDLNALLKQADNWYQQGVRTLVTKMPASALTTLSNHFSERSMLLLNAGSTEDSLRQSSCLNNVLHTIPSRAMLADALTQWLMAKRLKHWLLIEGQKAGDKAFADALRRGAKRFGAKIIATKQWTFDTDLRRTAQKELPLFTQTDEYDVVVVADELGDFGEYVLYNTWYPRPVVGTQGLRPTAWHRVVEQWGAAQLQSRFEKQAERWMTDNDYAAWLAVRSVGEAIAMQTKASMDAVPGLLTSDEFQLAGFKGRKLSYRPWSGQLRQPIPLIHPRALISQAPQEGFLHPRTDLDTLGYDKPESQCQIAKQFAATK